MSAIAQDSRDGETLNAATLTTYLRRHWAGFENLLAIRQYRSGFSNLTYALDTNLGRVVLRRPPFGPRRGAAHDMLREFAVLQGLQDVSVGQQLGPAPLLACETEAVLGAPFYLMEHVDGPIVRQGSASARQAFSRKQMESAAQGLIQSFTQLHSLSITNSSLAQLGNPTGYVERQVEGWIRRYSRAKTADVPALGAVADYLRQEMPADAEGCLVHNDYKFDNVVYRDDSFAQVAAILDWEMCTVGNPWMDLGLTLAYWAHDDEVAEMPFLGVNATHLPGCPRRSEIVEAYRAANDSVGSGQRVPSDLTYYFVFGNLKIAGIVQQIYARYAAGHTQDARFAKLNHVVSYLLMRAQRAMQAGALA